MFEHYVRDVEAALARSGGDWTAQRVLEEVTSHRAQFWPGQRSCAVTQVHEYGDRSALRIWLAAGDMDELLVMLESAEAWALNQGWDEIEVEGRKGWKRVLTPFGFREIDGVLRKELYHG